MISLTIQDPFASNRSEKPKREGERGREREREGREREREREREGREERLMMTTNEF